MSQSNGLSTMANSPQPSPAEVSLQREFECEVLNRMRQYLCNHLEPERFFPFLQTKNYLDMDSCEQIRAAGTTRNKVNKLLDILTRSGARPLVALVRAIERNGATQRFVAEKIKEEHKKWVNRPENQQRLDFAKEAQEDTIPCDQELAPLPPPYSITPRSNDVQSCVPSTFNLTSNSTKSGSKESTILSQFMSPDLRPVPPSSVRFVSSAEDVTPDCFVSHLDPSHFRTSDFHTRHEIVPQPSSQVFSDQFEAERKLPLPLDDVSSPLPLETSILSNQEKELSKYKPQTLHPSPIRNWPRSSRVPSEHEESNLATSVAEEVDSGSRTRPYKSQDSCQAGSIQPSSFSYSNIESQAITQTIDKQIPKPLNPSMSPRRSNPSSHNHSPLEPIPSGEVLASVIRNFSSVPIHTELSRNPTEHVDESMMTETDYENSVYESSLEISAASHRN